MHVSKPSACNQAFDLKHYALTPMAGRVGAAGIFSQAGADTVLFDRYRSVCGGHDLRRPHLHSEIHQGPPPQVSATQTLQQVNRNYTP